MSRRKIGYLPCSYIKTSCQRPRLLESCGKLKQMSSPPKATHRQQINHQAKCTECYGKPVWPPSILGIIHCESKSSYAGDMDGWCWLGRGITRELKSQVGQVGIGTATTVKCCSHSLSASSVPREHWTSPIFGCFQWRPCITRPFSLSIPGQQSVIMPYCTKVSCVSSGGNDNPLVRLGPFKSAVPEHPESDHRSWNHLLDCLRECVVLGPQSNPWVQTICCQTNWQNSANMKSWSLATHTRNSPSSRTANKGTFCHGLSWEWSLDGGTSLSQRWWVNLAGSTTPQRQP